MSKPRYIKGRTPNRSRARHRREQEVDEALRESFPASDPPAWTLGAEARPRRETAKVGPDELEDEEESEEYQEEEAAASEEGEAGAERVPRAERRPEERRQEGHGPGRPFGDLDQGERAVQTEPHLARAQCDDRTDLPGRRTVREGPHQAFPGAPRE